MGFGGLEKDPPLRLTVNSNSSFLLLPPFLSISISQQWQSAHRGGWVVGRRGERRDV